MLKVMKKTSDDKGFTLMCEIEKKTDFWKVSLDELIKQYEIHGDIRRGRYSHKAHQIEFKDGFFVSMYIESET